MKIEPMRFHQGVCAWVGKPPADGSDDDRGRHLLQLWDPSEHAGGLWQASWTDCEDENRGDFQKGDTLAGTVLALTGPDADTLAEFAEAVSEQLSR